MTYDEKLRLFEKGWYQFPMCEHAARCRTPEHWIAFIDQAGQWLPNQGKRPYMLPEWLRRRGVSLSDPEYYDAGTILDR